MVINFQATGLQLCGQFIATAPGSVVAPKQSKFHEPTCSGGEVRSVCVYVSVYVCLCICVHVCMYLYVC